MTFLSANVVSLASIHERELEPLWPGVLWLGKPTMLVGDPGLGKSQITLDIAARVTRGLPWPCSQARNEPGDVVLISAEDDASDTIKPRLLAAGADTSRVKIIRGVTAVDEKSGERENRWLSLPQHLDVVRDAILDAGGEVRLVVIDPIGAFLGSTDSHKNSDVRAVMDALSLLAAELRVAVLCVSHLNKSSGKALYRVTGSLAFVAAARAVYAVMRDPNDPDGTRIMGCVKNNLAKDSLGYQYCVREADNGAPFISWSNHPLQAAEVQRLLDDGQEQTPRERHSDRKTAEAINWLRERFAGEIVPAALLFREAETRNLSERSVRAALKQVGAQSGPAGYQGSWHYEIPKVIDSMH